jgi:hypothetical protein
MTSDAEFREAVRRLHRAKDAAYRDAWKRRGEVISILANIARKVDQVEYYASSIQPVRMRLARVQALTDAAVVLAGALRREHAHTYAEFISSCMAMEGGAC